MSVTIKVTPEKLVSEANALRERITAIKGSYTTIGDLVLKFPSCWEGEACNFNRDSLNRYLSDAKKQAEEILERTERLMRIAGVYSDAEQENQLLTGKLETNVIK